MLRGSIIPPVDHTDCLITAADKEGVTPVIVLASVVQFACLNYYYSDPSNSLPFGNVSRGLLVICRWAGDNAPLSDG